MRQRMFAAVLFVAVASVLTLIVAVGYVKPRGPSFTYSAKGMQPGTAVLARDVWVTRQPDGSFVVFQNRDPHLGHTTAWRPQSQQFMSPAHGEMYDITGTCLAGPCGPASLYRVKFNVDDEVLEIFPDEVVAGGFPK